jgi:thiol-disulfide isomerase/thioredoxin
MTSPDEVKRLLDVLIDEGVVEFEADTDAVTTSEDFEHTRSIYHDTYSGVSETEFQESVADVFDLESRAAAARRIEELGITREEFVSFLSLQSYLDGYDVQELTQMAGLVTELTPGTPVPAELEVLDDESYASFVDSNERAVVTVWKFFCDPCNAMKDEIDDLLAAFPEDAVVGGLDSENSPNFLAEYDVDAAPAICLFEHGELLHTITGRTSPEPLAERCSEVYDR